MAFGDTTVSRAKYDALAKARAAKKQKAVAQVRPKKAKKAPTAKQLAALKAGREKQCKKRKGLTDKKLNKILKDLNLKL